ncbi:MAG: fibronectin type III domain-containing protein, partial [bacterium]|nr:fibronectin type III domain-containing protein [bacterium]
MDLTEGVLERRIGGLAAGTEYRLRLSALDGEGAPGASAAATFATLAPPVRGLSAAPAEAGGLRLSWGAPAGWAPTGYALRWRERGGGEFVGEVSLGASARSHVVTDLSEGVEYVARVSPLNAVGREGDPADLDVAVAAGGLVVLAGAGADWLMVRWAERFAPGAAGFRLAWREASAGDGGTGQSGVGLVEGARERRVAGLAAGTRYRLRLVALSPAAAPGAAAEAVFSTPAPPVVGLAGAAVAHDAVALSWEGPAGWSPEGYAVRWRLAGADGPLGRLLLPPGRRAQTVAGLAGGAEYEFTVTARTEAGGQSRPAAVVVATPAAPEGGLVLEVSAPAYCIADEGSVRTQDRIDPDTGRVDLVYQRVGVASLPLQWRVSGGRAPYKLRLPGGERAGAAGAAEVSCARAGLDLDDLPDGEVSVVEAGPKTFTVEATDVTGNTASRTITVEVIEAAHSAGSWHRGDHLEPGRTYSHFGLFIEIPEQASIAYGGAVEADDVYDSFLGPLGGLRITDLLIAPSTGEEGPANISRTVYELDDAGGVFPNFGAPLTDAENAFWDRFLANIRTSPFPEGDPRNEQPAPLARSGGVSGAAGASTPKCSDDGTTLVDFAGGLWRPYGRIPGTSPVLHGLSCDRRVAVHPSLPVGDAVTVCVSGTARDDLLAPAVAAAVDEWNGLLAPDPANPDPAQRLGLGFAPFDFDAASPSCPSRLSAAATDYIQIFDVRRCTADTGTDCPVGKSPAVATTNKSLNPPRVEWNIMRISIAAGTGKDATEREQAIQGELERLVRHELGHFLGLADYFAGCWRLEDGAGVVQPSTMSYGRLAGNAPDGAADPSGCRSDAAVTDRDLDDLHAIYHPHAVWGLALEESALAGRWQLRWRLPSATPTVFNAAFLGVARRALSARDPASGAPAGPAAWELFGLQVPTQTLYVLPASADLRGYEYAVAGLPLGDHERGIGTDVGVGLSHLAWAPSRGR